MLRYPCRRGSKVSALAVLGVSILILTAPPASAHESRRVGEFTFVVGWYDEPAFAHQPNGPEVTITHKEDPVVEGVDLSVDVIFGEESTTYDLEPAFIVGVFGDPGNYNADLFPTRPGTWEFRIYGTVEGTEVDETFTSGPETFSDIEDPAEIAFPLADPNNAELSERIQTEANRVATVQSEAATAKDDASSARTLALIGIILGAIGLVVGGTLGGLALRKRG